MDDNIKTGTTVLKFFNAIYFDDYTSVVVVCSIVRYLSRNRSTHAWVVVQKLNIRLGQSPLQEADLSTEPTQYYISQHLQQVIVKNAKKIYIFRAEHDNISFIKLMLNIS